jgi:hypothetical protein
VRSESRCALRLRYVDLVQTCTDARGHHFQHLLYVQSDFSNALYYLRRGLCFVVNRERQRDCGHEERLTIIPPSPFAPTKFLTSKLGNIISKGQNKTDLFISANNQLTICSFLKQPTKYNIKVLKHSWQRINRQAALAEQ